MGRLDTSMGGSQGAFPETAWATLLSGGRATGPERAEALNALLARYWRPIYAYIRGSRRVPVEEAKDLTQAFLSHLLERSLLDRFDASQGRFRAFLKGAVRIFLAESKRNASTERKGGGRAPISLDVEAMENGKFLADPANKSPEELFDRQWAQDLVAEAVQRLREECARDGRGEAMAVYEALDLHAAPDDRPSYDALAARFGISTAQVANHLSFGRRRMRELLKDRIAGTVASPDEIDDELREMLGS